MQDLTTGPVTRHLLKTTQTVGRKDHAEAGVLFNQAQVLAMVTGLLFLIVGLAVRWPYARAMSADAHTAELAAQYLLWFIPAMALQFCMVAMGSALRAIGSSPGDWPEQVRHQFKQIRRPPASAILRHFREIPHRPGAVPDVGCNREEQSLWKCQGESHACP